MFLCDNKTGIKANSIWFAVLFIIIAISSIQLAYAQGLGINIDDIRAQIVPTQQATLSAEFNAKVNNVYFKEGQRFKKGDLLVSFDCDLQKAKIKKAKATLEGAQNIHAGNAHLSTMNAIGEVELKASAIEVKKAIADLDYLNVGLSKCNIYAPYSGVAGVLHSRPEQFVQAGQALLEIFDDSVLELEFIVPSRIYGQLNDGHQFQVLIDETGISYPAKLIRLSGRADAVSQSIKVIAEIDKKYKDLVPGMSGRVNLFVDVKTVSQRTEP